MGSYRCTDLYLTLGLSLAKTRNHQETDLANPKIIMSMPVKTYSKLKLLTLRPAKTTQKIEQTAAFQKMLEIATSIPTKYQDLDGSETEHANAKLVECLRAKEELRMAKKHRNFLKRKRAGKRKAYAKKRQELEKSEKATTSETPSTNVFAAYI